jgi:hypothetical protein
MRLRNLAGVLPDRAASRFMVFFRLDANHPVRILLKVIVERGGLESWAESKKMRNA